MSGIAALGAAVGCAGPRIVDRAVVVAADEGRDERPRAPMSTQGPWIGAAMASDAMLAGPNESFVAVWVDVPKAEQKVHAPASVAIVIDTSGSMAGAKIGNARKAAAKFVDGLADGDFVSLHTFSDAAEVRVAPVKLDARSRAELASAIDGISAEGGTNLFEGVRAGGLAAMAAPEGYAVKRVVLISDGLATAGDTSRASLSLLGEKAAEHGVQITSVGVGLDYDEKALNALAINSAGRLYHLEDPGQLAGILSEEMSLLSATRATDAFVEIVAAPGVELLGVEGARSSREGAALKVPLGSMFGGQHKEFIVRVRSNAPSPGTRAIAGVRLTFQDPAEDDLARIQEAIARVEVVTDPALVERRKNRKAEGILAMIDASKSTEIAIASIHRDDFKAADDQLAQAEKRMTVQAENAADPTDKARFEESAARIRQARTDVGAAAAAPPSAAPAMKRGLELRTNDMEMDMNGM
ncbi:MAG: VWA domain-containing protein [Polyangiaceae bacterium]